MALAVMAWQHFCKTQGHWRRQLVTGGAGLKVPSLVPASLLVLTHASTHWSSTTFAGTPDANGVIGARVANANSWWRGSGQEASIQVQLNALPELAQTAI
jgi:hypothetical protein